MSETIGALGELLSLTGYAWGVGAVFGLMTLVWLVSLVKDDVSLVDIVWGPAVALAAWVYALTGPRDWQAPWRLLPLVLVTLWALRLGVHIARRHDGEDRRYRKMRERVGPSFRWRSLATVFYLQGALVAVISWPLLFAVQAPRPERFTLLDGLGVLLWLIGFTFEAVGDWQLTRFKADPENSGEVLDTGLWRYTRHPNYFGDACLWWGYAVFALNAEGTPLFAGLAVFSAAVMTFFLLQVSGVTLLEKDIEERRPDYRDYIERTSAFFPWPPQKSPSENSLSENS